MHIIITKGNLLIWRKHSQLPDHAKDLLNKHNKTRRKPAEPTKRSKSLQNDKIKLINALENRKMLIGF